jgi:hypothetical protein
MWATTIHCARSPHGFGISCMAKEAWEPLFRIPISTQFSLFDAWKVQNSSHIYTSLLINFTTDYICTYFDWLHWTLFSHHWQQRNEFSGSILFCYFKVATKNSDSLLPVIICSNINHYTTCFKNTHTYNQASPWTRFTPKSTLVFWTFSPEAPAVILTWIFKMSPSYGSMLARWLYTRCCSCCFAGKWSYSGIHNI